MNNENELSNDDRNPNAGLNSLETVKSAFVDLVQELPQMKVGDVTVELEALFATAFTAQTHLHPVTNRCDFLLAKQLTECLEELLETIENISDKSTSLKELIEMYDLATKCEEN